MSKKIRDLLKYYPLLVRFVIEPMEQHLALAESIENEDAYEAQWWLRIVEVGLGTLSATFQLPYKPFVPPVVGAIGDEEPGVEQRDLTLDEAKVMRVRLDRRIEEILDTEISSQKLMQIQGDAEYARSAILSESGVVFEGGSIDDVAEMELIEGVVRKKFTPEQAAKIRANDLEEYQGGMNELRREFRKGEPEVPIQPVDREKWTQFFQRILAESEFLEAVRRDYRSGIMRWVDRNSPYLPVDRIEKSRALFLSVLQGNLPSYEEFGW